MLNKTPIKVDDEANKEELNHYTLKLTVGAISK